MTNPDPPFPGGEQHPWRDYPPAPVDPQAPVNYPDYPPPYSPQPPPVPPYGYPCPPQGGPPGYGGPMGYGGPPGYPGPYDPYQPYQVRPLETNRLAIGSLVTSIAGVVLGIPLTFFCYIGLLIPIVGAVLGAVALNQIKRTNQQGRGLAIAGIVVGAVPVVLLVVIVIAVMAVALSSSSSR